MRHSIPSQTAEERSSGDPREQLERIVAFARRVLRHGWVVAIVLGLGAIACALFFWLRTPSYRSETVILYSEGIRSSDATGDPGAVTRNAPVRLREMLMSRQRLEKVIDEFKLYPDVIAERGYVDAVEEFREDIEFRAPGSDTYAIGYKGTSPEQAKAVTERLVSTLMAEDSNLRRQQATLTRDFLDTEKQKTIGELRRTETELAKFMAEHPGFANDIMLLQTGGGSATGAAIRATQTARAATPAPAPRYRVVSRPSSASPAGAAAAAAAPAASDPSAAQAVRDLEAERARADAALAAARTDLASKLARFTEAHPDVRAAQAALERARARSQNITQQLASARPVRAPVTPAAPAANGARTVRRVVAVSAPTPAAAAASAAAAAAESDTLVKLETDWAKLTRNVTEARQRHDSLEASFFKADLAAQSQHGGQAVQMTVIDPAYLPLKPVPPGPITWAAIFFALSLLVGMSLAVAGAAVDDRIYAARDAFELAPLLVEVPSASRDKRRQHG